jgi:hypothetical protein
MREFSSVCVEEVNYFYSSVASMPLEVSCSRFASWLTICLLPLHLVKLCHTGFLSLP